MKNIKLLIAGIFILFASFSLLAQDPPDPPGEHGELEDQGAGGNAPIGAGTLLLISLGAVYGGKKIYDLRKKEE